MNIYRDTQGDLWALTDDGRRWLCAQPDGVWEGPIPREWWDIEMSYGPLRLLPDTETEQAIAEVTYLCELIPAPGVTGSPVGNPPSPLEPTVDHTSTTNVLNDVLAERGRQDEKWGQQNHPDGTGPRVRWMEGAPLGHSAAVLAGWFRDRCKANVPDQDNYLDILMEEVAEAFAEDDPAKLRAELIQIAAVAVQWVEAIDRRATDPGDPRTAARRPPTTTIWEKCAACGDQFAYPHLCREHMLCGICHPPIDERATESVDQ